MPYAPKKKTYKKKKAVVSKPVRSYVRSELRKVTNTQSPLCWVDIPFTGGNVNTTPTVHSFGEYIRGSLLTSDSVGNWPSRMIPGGDRLAEAKVRLTYIHYQLRYEQDIENLETSNTFRWLMYSFTDTWSENPAGILAGSDVDSPPKTEKVMSMYYDKMATLHPSTTEVSTDDTQGTPGSRIYKGNRKLNKVFKYVYYPDDGPTLIWENEDVRWESQSDTVGAGLQLYGFIRIYYRVYE